MTVLGAELDGQVAVITGAGRPDGLGAAMGRLFAERGATIVLTDVLDELGEHTAAEIEHGEYLHLDVSSETEWDAVVSQVVARHGVSTSSSTTQGSFVPPCSPTPPSTTGPKRLRSIRPVSFLGCVPVRAP